MRTGRSTYQCSFCGKSQDAVHRLIAGSGGVYICDECIELCRAIIAEEKAAMIAPRDMEDSEQVPPPARAEEKAPQQPASFASSDVSMGELLAPLVAEVAAARSAIERLASENGALRERVRALEAGTSSDTL